MTQDEAVHRNMESRLPPVLSERTGNTVWKRTACKTTGSLALLAELQKARAPPVSAAARSWKKAVPEVEATSESVPQELLEDQALNWDIRQFAKSLIYEALPLGFNYILIFIIEVGLLKHSVAETWCLISNRLYGWVTLGQGGIVAQLLHLPNLLMCLGVTLVALDADGVRKCIQPIEALTWTAMYLTRCITIAIKYGHSPPSLIRAQYLPKPDLPGLFRHLFAAGWSRPLDYPGLLNDELEVAMMVMDTNLNFSAVLLEPYEAMSFIRDIPMCSIRASHRYGSEIRAQGQITALDLAWFITLSAFGQPVDERLQTATTWIGRALPAVSVLARAACGLPVMGNTWQATLACISFLLGPVFATQSLLSFQLVAYTSYIRRAKAILLLDELCGDGIKLRELLKHVPRAEAHRGSVPGSNTVHVEEPIPDIMTSLDLDEGTNLMAVVLIRQVLRQVGRRYHARIDKFSILLFLLGGGMVAMLNVFFVLSPNLLEHTLPTDLLLVMISTLNLTMVVVLVIAASECNKTDRYRTQLQRHLLVTSGRLLDLVENEDSVLAEKGTTFRKEHNSLTALRDLLDNADRVCEYDEETVNPVSVLNVPASTTTVLSTLGLVLGGIFTAAQGALTQFSSGAVYRASDGMFISADPNG